MLNTNIFNFYRAFASLLVFLHHFSLLTGRFNVFQGYLGIKMVDLFMFVSGFLMYYQVHNKKIYDNFNSFSGIRNFYLKRFFRISPLYYFLLFIALLIAPILGFFRENIEYFLGHEFTNLLKFRYFNNDYLYNYFIHISYLFGFIPKYSYSTPLPDWSIGLEIMFYLFFPALFIIFFKNMNIKKLIILIFCMLLIKLITIHILHLFYPMPTFLPLKFHNFLAGILVSYLLLNNKNKYYKDFIYLLILSVYIYISEPYTFLIFIMWFTYFYLKMELSFLDLFFKSKVITFFSNISYSLYLVHLILLLPFVFYMQKLHINIIFCFLICSFFIFTISYLLFKFIEEKGIILGNKLIQKGIK